MKILGALLLIIGTSIGGGILALPMATATLGFIPATLYLCMIWLMMTLGALLLLEVNTWFPIGSHLISMAGLTIGKWGQGLTWLTYLLLLYSLISSYIAGGRDILISICTRYGIFMHANTGAFLFTLFFSVIVFLGIRRVDHVNRIVMLIKLLTYFGMVFFILPYGNLAYLTQSTPHFEITASTLMVMATAFGFAIIIPSLRIYFENDLITLRRIIMGGSCIPLVLYLLWNTLIFLTVPQKGAYGLEFLAHSTQPVSALMQILNHISAFPWMTTIADIFTSVCIITAILGVALCLIDFLADGLKMRKTGFSGLALLCITFVPPLCIALFAPLLFFYGFSVAGIFCVFLLILLPTWMAWRGRYRLGLKSPYPVWGGKPVLIALITGAWLLLATLAINVMKATSL